MTLAAGAGRRTEPPRAARVALIAVGAAAAALLAAVLVYPSFVLVLSSFVAGGRLSLALYAQLAADAQVYTVLLHSLVVSVAATAGGIVLGVALAWIVSRTDVPGRAAWRTALLLPYMIPPFIGAIAWVYLLSPVGYLNQIWMALTGSATPLAVVYGPVGIIGVMVLYGYPIVFLASLGVLERMNPVLEEAARMSRAGPWGVFWEITVPLMLPGLLAGALLLLMSLLGDFGIPAVIGFPARYYVLTTRIYETILNFDQRDNLNLAAALSMWLVVIAAVLLWLQRWLQRRNRFAVVGGQAGGVSLVTLGRWRYPIACGLGAFVTVSVVLPLAAILVTSLIRAYGLPPAPNNLTLAHYAEVIAVPKVPRALLNSLELAAGSATLILVLAVGFGYLLTRVRLRGSAVLDLVITIPYAIPGTVVALGMILAWLRPIPIIGLRLYDTFWIIFLAYIARFLAIGVRTVLAGLAQVQGTLEEAARISGAGPLQAFLDIVVPIIRPSLAAGWVLAFIPAVAELTLSILLFSVGNETLGVTIFGLNDEGKATLTAALAFLVTMMLLVINLASRAVLRGADGATRG
ncbi:MAG TPA: iron ABC transporter permease [bacterium]|nr:iron ABC transporter permease [bacterium]